MSEIKDYAGNVLRVGDVVAKAYMSGRSPWLETRVVQSVDDDKLILKRDETYSSSAKLGKNYVPCDPKKCILIDRPGWRWHHCKDCGHKRLPSGPLT